MAKINHTDFTYQVSYKWLSMNTDDRTDKIRAFLKEYPDYSMIEVQDAFDNGHVVLRMKKPSQQIFGVFSCWSWKTVLRKS